MLKYYLSSQYRRRYDELAALRLVGDEEGDISAHEIEEFIVKKGLIDGQTISRYLEIILDGKQTAAGCLKQLIFLHRYLQASKSIDQTLLLAFINKILRFVQGDLIQRDQRQSFLKMYRSEILIYQSHSARHSLINHIIKPYVSYLQKIVARFDLYNYAKNYHVRAMDEKDIWAILNLLKYATGITKQTASGNRELRRMYGNSCECIMMLFSVEYNKLYQKLYKYVRHETNRIQKVYYELQNKFGEDGVLQRWPIETIDSIVNLLQEVELVNKDIDVMYNRIAGRERINRPIYIDVQNDQFYFIMHLWESRLKFVESGQKEELVEPLKRRGMEEQQGQDSLQDDDDYATAVLMELDEGMSPKKPTHISSFKEISNLPNFQCPTIVTFRKIEAKQSSKLITPKFAPCHTTLPTVQTPSELVMHVIQ